ncbi:MAG: zinc-dependent peptidase [Pseudomonadota bacterium]|nr:zinc-dependent peptidase [Pseudomonadota bacterium]
MREWWRRWRADRTLERRPIPEALWQLTLARFPFLGWRGADDLATLRELTTLFLADKEFTGTRGLVVTDEMAVAIAAQACLPALRLGLGWYAGFKGIVVHADAVVAQREIMDEDGVVHAYEEALAGEAMQGGPVMLAWHDVDTAAESADAGYNVVIHEFVHVMDMHDGQADGVPPLPDREAIDAWTRVLDAEYDAFCERVDRGEDTFLDPYAAEAPEEFFAVTSEMFFVAPADLQLELPRMYTLLAGFFLQDPMSCHEAVARR